MPPAYTTRFDEAMAFTTAAFRSRWRKSTGAPYITHLMAVCAKVGENGGDEDQLIAALLHDYLEDIPGASIEELTQRFGPRVTRLVVALSDTMCHPKPPWRERKEAYLAELGGQPGEVKLICAADKWHNCVCITHDVERHGLEVFDRFRGRRDGTLWYYRRCVEELGRGWHHPLLIELDGVVGDLYGVAAPGRP